MRARAGVLGECDWLWLVGPHLQARPSAEDTRGGSGDCAPAAVGPQQSVPGGVTASWVRPAAATGPLHPVRRPPGLRPRGPLRPSSPGVGPRPPFIHFSVIPVDGSLAWLCQHSALLAVVCVSPSFTSQRQCEACEAWGQGLALGVPEQTGLFRASSHAQIQGWLPEAEAPARSGDEQTSPCCCCWRRGSPPVRAREAVCGARRRGVATLELRGVQVRVPQEGASGRGLQSEGAERGVNRVGDGGT